MRILLAAALAAAIAAPALAADPLTPEAQAGVDAVTATIKSAKNARFRKVKTTAAGDVCGTVSPSSSSRDIEFLWTKSTDVIWINEAAQEPQSEFGYGIPNLKRSTERADYKVWKACQTG
jgi:opacity protein-like surface antigen